MTITPVELVAQFDAHLDSVVTSEYMWVHAREEYMKHLKAYTNKRFTVTKAENGEHIIRKVYNNLKVVK